MRANRVRDKYHLPIVHQGGLGTVSGGSVEQMNMEEKDVSSSVKFNLHTIDKHNLEDFITGAHQWMRKF